MHVQTYLSANDTRRYVISGQIFFSSANKFYDFFDFKESIKIVELDVNHAHFWDVTSVNMFNQVIKKFELQGIDVQVMGLNEASSTLIDQLNLPKS